MEFFLCLIPAPFAAYYMAAIFCSEKRIRESERRLNDMVEQSRID